MVVQIFLRARVEALLSNSGAYCFIIANRWTRSSLSNWFFFLSASGKLRGILDAATVFYVYIYMCVCVCVCKYMRNRDSSADRSRSIDVGTGRNSSGDLDRAWLEQPRTKRSSTWKGKIAKSQDSARKRLEIRRLSWQKCDRFCFDKTDRRAIRRSFPDAYSP